MEQWPTSASGKREARAASRRRAERGGPGFARVGTPDVEAVIVNGSVAWQRETP